MWTRWFPWRFFVRRIARKHGFIDPVETMVQLEKFGQPSEVAAPIELMRLASVLHVRGLMNSQVIQHNLDWVWPFWVTRQFDPHDPAFIPRAFSLTQINLTHRNWTAVGIPGYSEYPLIDPRGLLTPFYDGWSLDSWVVTKEGENLVPSRLSKISQELILKGNLAVETKAESEGLSVTTRSEAFLENNTPICRLSVKGLAKKDAWLAISLRPFNPEGVSFVYSIDQLGQGNGWKVDQEEYIYFNNAPDQYQFSNYREGDVFGKLFGEANLKNVNCDVGMATAAALFHLEKGKEREIVVTVPLKKNYTQTPPFKVPDSAAILWKENIEGICQLNIPDKKFQFLYEAAVKTLVLHSPHEVYAGPFTYKHFWFRDAAIISHGMLCAGLYDRVEEVLSLFPNRQSMNGYFCSQDGEWDSNGQVLWILECFYDLTGRFPKGDWEKSILKACKWIQKKRLSKLTDSPHAGLLPPGFSAEHLGPNDYYYWDDFWCLYGLRAGAKLLRILGQAPEAQKIENEADSFQTSIEKSLALVAKRLHSPAIPASPYRRMDAGAVGSLTAGYPLKLWPAGDAKIAATADYLLKKCFVDGAFFHDVSHSGINPYLTLHVAQVLLREGDPRHFNIMKNLAGLASQTGQWPEAIHPKNKSGCMGDGQHVWAAAEWILMIRNCFIREEEGKLIFCSGIPSEWLESGEEISFGPAATAFGTVSLSLKSDKNHVKIAWEAKWRKNPPQIEIIILNNKIIPPSAEKSEITVDLRSAK